MIKLSYTERTYSPKKFMEYIEHRIRKDVRLNKPIKPRDTVYLLDDGSKEFFIAKHFLKNMFGQNITVKAAKDKDVDGKLVIPTNLEREISKKLRLFLENIEEDEDPILILDNVLEEEIVAACKVLGREEKKEEEVHFLIEKMQGKYPDTLFSLHRAFEKLDAL